MDSLCSLSSCKLFPQQQRLCNVDLVGFQHKYLMMGMPSHLVSAAGKDRRGKWSQASSVCGWRYSWGSGCPQPARVLESQAQVTSVFQPSPVWSSAKLECGGVTNSFPVSIAHSCIWKHLGALDELNSTRLCWCTMTLHSIKISFQYLCRLLADGDIFVISVTEGTHISGLLKTLYTGPPAAELLYFKVVELKPDNTGTALFVSDRASVILKVISISLF